MQEQATSSLAASSLPSSSERSSSSAPHLEIKEGIESDEEIRRVPEFGGEAVGKETSGRESGSATGQERTQATVGESQRKRGRTPAEKENKRLKRLLRNRVSAQQARERKKAYLSELENRVKDLENKNSELEERLSTLQNENQMLRHILKNTTGNKRGGGGGSNADASLLQVDSRGSPGTLEMEQKLISEEDLNEMEQKLISEEDLNEMEQKLISEEDLNEMESLGDLTM